MGVKGLVTDVETGKGIPNALIQVKNITRVSKGSRMNVDINHDITSGELSIPRDSHFCGLCT